MAQINIPNSGLWSSIAASLNSNFDERYNSTGWAFYSDTQYTDLSPFTVNQGVTSSAPNNKGTVIETQLPAGVTTFYDGSVITPENANDFYNIGIRFACTSSVQEGAIAVKLDIGGSQGVISSESRRLARGAGSTNTFEINFSVFTGSTFIANGGTVQFESITGNTDFWFISYLISRTHLAR